MVNLNINMCGIKFDNPLILASGFLGVSKNTLERVGKSGAGGLTLKSFSDEEREGNKNPTIIGDEYFFFNAVNLPGQGVDNIKKEYGSLDNLSKPVIASIFGNTVEDFGKVAKKVDELKPAMIEVNVSCPHHDYGKKIYADIDLLTQITKIVKRNTKAPVSIKLSPNVEDIIPLAKAVEKAGADAITAINTLIAMKIDINARKPVLANKIGGLSGPSIKPVAIRMVYQIYQNVKIPIIGTGGISTGEDAIEMIMAGATGIGIGTACYHRGIEAFEKIKNEMTSWMKKNNVKDLKEIRGAAHD